MNDDRIALIGCAVALLVSGGFLAISYPLGQLLRRRSSSTTTEQRTVAFRMPAPTEAETSAQHSDRKAA